MILSGENVGAISYSASIDTKQIKADAAQIDDIAKGTSTHLSSQFEGAAGRAGDSIKKFAKVAAVALAAVATATIAFGVSSVKSYMASEDAIVGLEAGLKNTGEAVDVISKKLQAQATALQKTTKFSDEEIVSADAMLTTFQLQGSTIEKLTPTLLDMAEGLRDVDGNTMSLSDAAKMMGKVMGNSEGGIDGMSSALKRNGVIMTDAQAEIFKTGTEIERANTLTEILSYNFGGRALAAGKTYSGQMTILANAFDDVKESIGLAILQGIQPLMDKTKEFVNSDQFKKWLTDLTEWLKTNLPIAIQYVTETLLPALKKIFDDIWPSIQTVLIWVGDLITFLSNNTWIIWAVVDAFIAIKTAMFISGVVSAFQLAFAVVTGVFNTFTLVTIPAADLAFSTFVASIGAPIAVAAIGVAAIWAVYNAAQAAIGALDALKTAMGEGAKVTDDIRIAAQNAKARGDIASYDKYQKIYMDSLSRNQQISKDASNINMITGFSTGLKSLTGIDLGWNAGGTDNWRGGPTVVGENGPEIVNLPRGAQVIPNDKISGFGGKTGSEIIYNIGTITIGSEVDGERWLKKLTQNQEIISNGLTPTQRYA